MATRKIETTIALDGEQAFKQALSSAAREMRVLESASRTLDAAYASNGDRATYLASRQQNLQQQLAQQDQVVKALENAVKDAAQAYGEGSSEVDGYAIKLNNARTKQVNLQKSLKQVDREIEELGRDSTKAGRQLQEGIGEGAENAEKDVKSLMSTMQDSLSSIQNSATFQMVSGLWDMASNAWSSVTGFVDETADFRRQLSMLQLSATQHGFDFEDLKEEMTSIAGVTGDASGAIEGLINLVSTGMSEYQLERAIEGLLGATLQFPDMDYNSLAQGLQETLSTGQASGSFLELIERIGKDVEAFNAALQKSPTLAGDVEIALAQLAAGGLNDLTKAYKDANETLTRAQELKAALEAENAELGGTLEKYLTNPAKEVELSVKKAINDLVETAETEGVDAAAEKIGSSMGNVLKGRAHYTWTDITRADPGTIALDVLGLATGGPIIWGAQRMFGPQWLERETEAMQANIEAAEKISEAAEDLATAYAEASGQPSEVVITNAETGRGVSLSPIGAGRDANDVLNRLGIDVEEYKKSLEKAGEEAGEALTEGIEAGMAGGDSVAESAGADFGAAFASGIMGKVSYVGAAAGALAAAAAARLSTSLASGGTTGVINLDGRQVGTVLFPTMSEMMAVNTSP